MLSSIENRTMAYDLKVTEIKQTIAALKKQIDRLSLGRIGLFLLEILFFILLIQSKEGPERWGSIVAMLAIILSFILIVRKQTNLDKEIIFQTNLLWIYQNEINIVEENSNGYNQGEKFTNSSHPYSSDLDIFGPQSLFAGINRAATAEGNKLLAKSLSNAFSKSEILERQIAITELVSKIEPTFDFRANLRDQDHDKIKVIQQKLDGRLGTELAFTRATFLRYYVAAVPFISFVLLMGAMVIGGVFTKVLILYALAHLAYNGLTYKKATQVFNQFSRNADLLSSYAKAIAYTEDTMWTSSYIKKLFNDNGRVSIEINQLSAIIQSFDARLNILIGVLLNVFLLWDVRCSIRLDKWQSKSSKNIIAALERIGHFEELISFATFSYNHLDYVVPTIQDNYFFSTTAIGHPLIPENTRVYNNFNFAKNPTVDIVTGSNMAGKSTFLRTVGINMVLAYAGSVVCGARLSLSVFNLVSYMQIADSLNESTSTFKAELIRLKMILEHVQTQDNGFVLIDEMLRGTNSQDKYTGSKVFIEKLLSLNKPALFATHDLQLSNLAERSPNQVRNFNFDIQINNGQMHFDYKLKNGPCKTFNAAILLKEIGLSIE
ncbi:hypothetical protein ACVWYG_003599 [Pedobacter sp. UYEF25]